MSDLPKRIIVDQNGHYWRDFGDSLSMCPTTDANEDTEVAASYVPATEVASLKEEVEALRASLDESERAWELLDNLATMGFTETSGLDYVELQVDKEDVLAARELVLGRRQAQERARQRGE